MDLYLPDEFYALSESPNARRDDAREDSQWLGGEAYVAPLRIAIDAHADRAEPDPIWRVI
ncbi:MAG TPA: hypothetical protein VFV97_07940 [Rhodanobacteraceae bacterium]|nr:hypothetical protein [Rhodanobacteraceae bacterium]